MPNVDAFTSLLVILIALLILFFLSRRAPQQQPSREQQFRSTFTRPEFSTDHHNLWNELTRREKDVARLAAQGYSNAEIAAELGIRYKTVDAHLQRIYQKLKVRSRTQLAHDFRDLVD